MSIKRKTGWVLLIISFLIFNIFIGKNLGVNGFLMFYGLVSLCTGFVFLLVWLFYED